MNKLIKLEKYCQIWTYFIAHIYTKMLETKTNKIHFPEPPTT